MDTDTDMKKNMKMIMGMDDMGTIITEPRNLAREVFEIGLGI